MLVFMKDFGMALLFMSIFVGLMYMATARVVYVAAGVGLFAVAGALAVYLVPHVHERFAIWLDPWKDAMGSGYQLLQSLFTIADGGIIGAGFGRGYLLFPDHTPVVPELADGLHLRRRRQRDRPARRRRASCSLYLLFAWRGFRIAVYAPDGFSKLLAAGLATGVRPPDVHHHRRRHAPHPAHRHHAAVPELRRQLRHRQPHAGGAAAHGEQPHQHHPRRHRPRAPQAGGEGVAA